MDNSQFTQKSQKTNKIGEPQQSLVDQMQDVSEIPHINRDREDQTNYSDVFGESVANMDQIPRFGVQQQQQDKEKQSQQQQQSLDKSQPKGGNLDDKNINSPFSKKGDGYFQKRNSVLSQKSDKVVEKDRKKSISNKSFDKKSDTQQQNDSVLNNEKQQQSSQNQENPEKNEENMQNYELTFKPATYRSPEEIEQEKQQRLKERAFMSELYDLAEKLAKQDKKVERMQKQIVDDHQEVRKEIIPLKNTVKKNTEKVLETRKFDEPAIEKAFYTSLKAQIVQTMVQSTYKQKEAENMQVKIKDQQEQISNLNRTLGSFNQTQRKYVDNITRLEQEIQQIKIETEKKIMTSTSPQFEMNQITEVKTEFSKDEKSQTYLAENFHRKQNTHHGHTNHNNPALKHMWMSDKEDFADYQLFGIPMEKKKLKPIKSTAPKQLNLLENNNNNHNITSQNLSKSNHFVMGKTNITGYGNQYKSIDASIFELAKQNREQFISHIRAGAQQTSMSKGSKTQAQILRELDTTKQKVIPASKTFIDQPVLMKNQMALHQQKLLRRQQLLDEQEKIKQGLVKPTKKPSKKNSTVNLRRTGSNTPTQKNQQQQQNDENPSTKRLSKGSETPQKGVTFEDEQQQQSNQKKQLITQSESQIQTAYRQQQKKQPRRSQQVFTQAQQQQQQQLQQQQQYYSQQQRPSLKNKTTYSEIHNPVNPMQEAQQTAKFPENI